MFINGRIIGSVSVSNDRDMAVAAGVKASGWQIRKCPS